MIVPYDKEYKSTKNIMRGTAIMQPEFKELADWIDLTFGVKTINIIYDLLEKEQPRLNICFETEYERSKFRASDKVNLDSKKQKLISKKFMTTQFWMKINSEDKGKSFFGKIRKVKTLANTVWIYYSAFQPIAMWEANESIPQSKIDRLKKQLNNPDIWEISRAFDGVTFFLYTDKNMKEYENSSSTKIWADNYFNLLEQFDEFKYYKRDSFSILLDSKENFDNNYESNWYYYYK
jgi:hypothetical protein